MKQLSWWSPTSSEASVRSSGTLLSYRWVQTYVFELPALKHAELEASLRYKVQATLPVNAESYAFHTQIFRHGKKTCGAAFLASANARDTFPNPAKGLRIGVPLFVPRTLPPKVLLFITTPDGLVTHYYEAGLLTTSFAPIGSTDLELRSRILAKCADAEIFALAPDSHFPLPPDLHGKEVPEVLRTKLLAALPPWETPRRRRLPQVLGILLVAAGLLLCVATLRDAWLVRETRNEAWSSWLKKAESRAAAPSPQEQTALLIKALGAPIPELFEHLAAAWGSDTRIIDMEWAQGKLVLTATSSSALTSVRKLTADPWFHTLRVDDIKTQKDGSEVFTLEGGLSLDS
jgi:hypothetical protein